MIASSTALKLAIFNVASHGDTDIFPFPVENHVFHDLPEEAFAILEDMDANFSERLSRSPVLTSKNLAAVGYSGFRLGTQVDPFWNAYLLALVITIGQEIEARRVSTDIVFSYRFSPDHSSGSIFSKTIGWKEFQEAAVSRARSSEYVLRCDISDFYPRIYHHRLENALKGATTNGEAVDRIMKILSAIAGGPSYGLPVGGPAARLLSELLLNRVDRLLAVEGIHYGRFVDDYVIFASNREQAHSALLKLNTVLLANEGLSLQKAKTRLMTMAEFLSTSDFAEESVDVDSPDELEEQTFRRLRVHFDPYSPTASADYEALLSELQKFDIVGMLGRQLGNSRIDEGLTRRLLQSIRHLPVTVQNDAVTSILKSLDLLYPIFPSVMLLLRSVLDELGDEVRAQVFESLRALIAKNSYIIQVPSHIAYAIRVLMHDRSEEATILLAQLYKSSDSMMIKRDLILVMAHRGADFWISDRRTTFSTLTVWERRALLISSYILGDEGAHWRTAVKKDLDVFDQLLIRWAGSSKSKKGQTWEVPV